MSKHGARFKVNCAFCGNDKLIRPCEAKRESKAFYCDKECKRLSQVGKKWGKPIGFGENNPNYGKKWPTEKKLQASQKTIQRYVDFPELRIKSGSANRGQKFSPTRRKRMSDGKLNANRHLRQYRSNWQQYRLDTNWIDNMFTLASEDEGNLIKELGVYDPIKNVIGVVRDHKFSRRDGFKNKVYPELLRHPSNCQIITNQQNCSKQGSSSVSLKELFEFIRRYDKSWTEQQSCLELITKYETGMKYEFKKGGDALCLLKSSGLQRILDPFRSR